MAITNTDLKFLLYSKKHGVSFNNTLTLGRMGSYMTDAVLTDPSPVLRSAFTSGSEFLKDKYTENLFRFLGAETIDSMDFSNYENATIIHDLNTPVPASLYNKFSVVLDGGTIEHVFNFPLAITSCMRMVKTSGHFLGITPANNLMGHGFYQFSPELFYRIFSKENGFMLKKMFITADSSKETGNTWYEVADPDTVKQRIVLSGKMPCYLFYIAEKIADADIKDLKVQQSDYVEKWMRADAKASGQSSASLYSRIVPYKVRSILYVIRAAMKASVTETDDLGVINTNHFRKSNEL